ncbi:hypothetical protein [Cellulomonas sp.]|uniref:hypothetical protein n=1 Tax=Cellulomonas sp. TaxID=40001 RepID=UPI001B18E340|nr:hypothetical protein [Cellulomonas sp.]MBO9555595.1 hypothetical protein [Cellulomonas sp.]
MRRFIHDEWAPLSYIPELAEDTARPVGAPTWVDTLDARRLTAYRVLAAYRDNARRYFLPADQQRRGITNVDGYIQAEKAPADGIREYGDAALLVDTARALVLGEDQSITLPDDTPEPITSWLTGWARSEQFTRKLLQGEGDAATCGDSVYVLGPDAGKQRPRLRVYDPGFYFPDTLATLPGWDDDYPSIVHLAWEEEDDRGYTWVVRSTWQIRPLDTPRASPWGGLQTYACWFRKARYRVDLMLDNATVYSPEISRDPVVVQDWTDLGVDLIPVVHVPNTPHVWGQSTLTRVGQILDDIAGADTDLALGAQTSTSATFVTTGSGPAPLTGRPGEALGLPDGGSASWTDTSKNLVAMTGYLETLLDRIAVNTRLAQALLGRIQPNEVPSGYALQLGFHPARQLMREARTIRDEKFPLILRFALRLAQANGWAPAGDTPDIAVALGASLPADRAAAVAEVKDLLPVHGISTATAVRVLTDAGFPIEDAKAEVEAIMRERFDDAVKLFEATGNAAAAAQMLGVPPVTTTGLEQAAGQA